MKYISYCITLVKHLQYWGGKFTFSYAGRIFLSGSVSLFEHSTAIPPHQRKIALSESGIMRRNWFLAQSSHHHSVIIAHDHRESILILSRLWARFSKTGSHHRDLCNSSNFCAWWVCLYRSVIKTSIYIYI